MNKLFVYGCSFTYGNGCLPAEPYAQQYKKSEDDLIWPKIVAKEIGFKLYNYGMGAISNDIIFDNIIETFDEVTEGDIVILQKTFTHRFDIARKRKKDDPYLKKFLTITPHSEEALKYESPFQKANFLASIIKYNLDKNYTNKQNEILKNITKEEVNQQIKKHFDSNKLTTVVVGDKYIIESLLEKASKDANNKEVLNKVKLKKISID